MISFIIPTKNEEKVLERTLRALAAYTGEKEIIVSDGNSTDRTLEIARTYCDRVVVHTGAKRQNISEGRNAGAHVARGTHLLFLDADVIIDDIDTFCARALSYFSNNPKLCGLTVTCRVFPESETFMDWLIFAILIPFVFWLQNNILHTGGASGEFQLVRADAFRVVKGYDEQLIATEDLDLFWRLAKIGRTHFATDLLVHHTGRRAHTVGWPSLLTDWMVNLASAIFLRRSVAKEWTVIR